MRFIFDIDLIFEQCLEKPWPFSWKLWSWLQIKLKFSKRMYAKLPNRFTKNYPNQRWWNFLLKPISEIMTPKSLLKISADIIKLIFNLTCPTLLQIIKPEFKHFIQIYLTLEYLQIDAFLNVFQIGLLFLKPTNI